MKNKVTVEEINELMDKSSFYVQHIGNKTTLVVCTLPNNFVIVESSSCVDPVNYDPEIGETICRNRIINKVWELEGYALQKKVAEIK